MYVVPCIYIGTHVKLLHKSFHLAPTVWKPLGNVTGCSDLSEFTHPQCNSHHETITNNQIEPTVTLGDVTVVAFSDWAVYIKSEVMVPYNQCFSHIKYDGRWLPQVLAHSLYHHNKVSSGNNILHHGRL